MNDHSNVSKAFSKSRKRSRPGKPLFSAYLIALSNVHILGPFIREKVSRGLHKTRTPRINGTKCMFTAYSTQGQLKPRLILAEGFWDGLIQAAAYLARENVRINALKRCPRLAEAVNDCCARSVKPRLFSTISQTFTAERRALQWRENEFCLHLYRGKWRIEIHVKNEMCGVPQKKNKSCSYSASLRLRGRSMLVLPRQA